jgi:hypothetical protein
VRQLSVHGPLVLVAAFLIVHLAPHAGARIAGPAHYTLPAREAGLRFAPGTHPVDQQAVLDAVTNVQPAARRLLDIVDGAVTVTIGGTGRSDAAGYADVSPDGTASVVVDLGPISHQFGQRGVARLVLHELAHVVDALLVPPDIAAALDASVPPSYPCTAGDGNLAAACAGRSAREERFAESFAKWATEDIGIGLDFGYSVPPPLSLADWGAPLASLAAP